ncbi:MAG: hypothetical protein JSV86_14145 [Gemmatimonadota bacterium]|nr:MAG: hypothetical protein JSV86_14145 [Gemmatimonadota bacterium]
MFKTCIYCNRKLGSNESVEYFPVGRRLAFDGERGRLWVICEYCRRWNLSPLEERWEAIEECERRFYDTPQSFSTDNIGLARLPEGLELVRIGRPQRREFAAWRYGREFLRRRIRRMIVTGTQVAVSVAASLAGADIVWFIIFGGGKKVVARVRDADGRRLSVVRDDLKRVKLTRSDAADGWSLVVPYRPGEKAGVFSTHGKGKRETALLSGSAAIRAAGHILPKVNSWGGTESQVREAVTLIEDSRAPERLFARIAADERGKRVWGAETRRETVKKMDADVRLALEMAAHEESERRALEGELAILEQAWREAEEIASIADRLLIPESVEDWIRKQRDKLSGRQAN